MLSFVFPPSGDGTAGLERHYSASGAFAPNAPCAFERKTVDNTGRLLLDDRLVELEPPARTVTKKSGKVRD